MKNAFLKKEKHERISEMTVETATPETPILKQITNTRFKITFRIPDAIRM